MTYYTFHIDDSGAIEDIDEKIVNGQKIPVCKMYDDEEFNNLNDILQSINDYILNERALNIFKDCKTIPYELRNAKVLRKEKVLGFLKRYTSYNYYELTFPDQNAAYCYDWIDFEKSDVSATDNSQQKLKITSHQQVLDMIKENKSDSELSYSIETRKIVFNQQFDTEIDLFKIPLYSWGIYISERLKNKLEQSQITDIGFADHKEQLGTVWKPYFPLVEFSS
ncbi:hypothetical protein BBFL7_00491 [Flavobacteria bacterium BBFL7]|nr:hypothetical protein BBFL7_00491 [Flavobacteria bacterium BBFL7]